MFCVIQIHAEVCKCQAANLYTLLKQAHSKAWCSKDRYHVLKTHHAQAAAPAPLEIWIHPISHARFAEETERHSKSHFTCHSTGLFIYFFPIIIIENREVCGQWGQTALSSLLLLLASNHQIWTHCRVRKMDIKVSKKFNLAVLLNY